MNVILIYSQTKEFNTDTQSVINSVQFSQVPEMRVIDNKVPYQANIESDKFDYFKQILEQYGTVDIIGKWNDDGSKIDLDINKYSDALNDIKEFEKADVLGKDEDDNDTIVRSFTRVKSSKRPTLTQAELIQVNTFDNKFKREL